MRLEPGLYHMPNADVDDLIHELEAEGRAVLLLRDDVTDAISFFEAMKERLPLDPPVVGSEKWDALSDSLWGGLDAFGPNEVAIVWPGSRAMADTAPNAFAIACEILSNVATSLADHDTTVGEPTRVVAILV